jgi:energy-coupling factor transport system permease protein
MQVTKHVKASQISPGAWWLLGLAFAISSALAESSLTLLAIHAVLISIILVARESAPWSQSLRFYLVTGLLVVAIRVLFRVIFNIDSSNDVALSLPYWQLTLGPFGELNFFGRVSSVSLASAIHDGLKMSAIILSIGLANSLASPRRLLKATPGALYEVATAFVIALNLAPQLIASAKRVRQASLLRRGLTTRNARLLVPILEDTLERSMALAATMDSRGFGRQGALTVKQRAFARATSLLAVFALAVGSYLLLTSDQPASTIESFSVGMLALFASLKISSVRHVKTRYVIQPWRTRDSSLTLVSAILVAAFMTGAIR